MSVYRDRFDDSRTTISERTAGGSKTKVTRYVIKDDAKSSVGGRESRAAAFPPRYDYRRDDGYDRGDARIVEDIRIVRKTRDDSPEPLRRESRVEPREDRRETITIRRDEVDREGDRYWERDDEVKDRELVVSRAGTRVGEDRDALAIRSRSAYDDRDIERIVRRSEFYERPQQPQTIIIRQEPIIIRERARSRDRDDDRLSSRRSEISDKASTVVSRRTREPKDEEYFYEKKVRERVPTERRRDSLSPGDSVSQVGRRRRDSDSDDTMVYVRKETTRDGYDTDDGHRGRDLAAGALAGVGAAELIRNHKNKEGKETSSGAGRLVKDAGAGVVGAVAAEAIRRYRSKSRARNRSVSESRDGRSRQTGRRSRSRSRSSSGPRDKLKALGTIGIAAAALAAGAAFANKKLNGDEAERRKSRSRTRRGSRSRSRSSELSYLENDPDARDARNPKRRASVVAGAGVLGAAAAALIEHNRNKDNPRSESRSRIKQGIPIAATAVGAAALAKLYEDRKAKQGAHEILDGDGGRSRSRRRSQSRRGSSRARSSSAYYDGPSRAAYSDPNMVTYGDDPIPGNNYGPGYYGQAAPQEGYYNNNARDLVPAAAPAASTYDNSAGRSRSMSHGRARSLSSDSDERSRSRRRGGGVRDGAAAVAGAGLAAHEANKHDRRRRRNDRRSRQDSYTPDSYRNDSYPENNYGSSDPYASQSGFHNPSVSNFPPPPGSMSGTNPRWNSTSFQNAAHRSENVPNAQYGPQDFPPPPPGGVPNVAPQTPGYAPNQGYDHFAQGQNPYAPRYGGADVSPFSTPNDQHQSTAPDGIGRSRGVSPPTINVRSPTPDTSRSSAAARSYTPQNYTPSPGPTSRAMPAAAAAAAAASGGSPQTRTRSRSISVSPERHVSPEIIQPTPTNPADPINAVHGNVAHAQASNVNESRSLRDEVREEARQRTEGTSTARANYNDSRAEMPYMPSPDLRPASDEAIPFGHTDVYPLVTKPETPTMPNLVVPSPPTDGRPRSTPDDARSTSVPPEPRKSVSFNPRDEINEIPARRERSHSESGGGGSGSQRQHQRDEGERDRDRERDRRGDDDRRRRRDDRQYDNDRSYESERGHDSSRRDRDRDPHRRERDYNNNTSRRERSPASDDSGETVDLPPRFDERGNRRTDVRGRTGEEDVIAEKLDELFKGKGSIGKLFGSFLGSGAGEASNNNNINNNRDRDRRRR